MPNVIDVRVQGKNTAGLDQVAKEGKQAGKEIGEGLEKGFDKGTAASKKARKEIGEDLDKTAKDAEKAGKEAGEGFGAKLGEGISSATEGGAEGLVGGLTDSIKGAGGGIAAAGLALGGLLVGGLMQSMENKKIAGMLAVQVGATSQEAGHLGTVAGDVFADNFGDSMQDVADSLRAVLQNKLIDASAAEGDIKRLTELAMTAAQVVGEETNAIARAARQMLVNGLAGSAEEAMDIIVTASQKGLNVNDDLIDTIVEYSTKFRDLGVSGPEAMGLISQALEGGIRDTDTAADALKEFAIRAIDGSEATARGFEEIGLDAESMGAAVAQGGGTAREALRQVLNAMQDIRDPTTRAQAAVDLFGTKSEDAGRALLSMDLDTVAAQFGKVAGATQKAGDEITKATPAWETFWRNAKGKAADVFEFAFSSDLEVPEEAKKSVEEYNRAKARAAENEEAYRGRVDDASHALERQSGSIKKVVKSLAEQIQMQQDAAGVTINIAEAEIRYQKALDDTAESLKKNGKTLDVTTEKGRDNKQALLDQVDAAFRQIEAMEKQGATADDVRGFMEGSRQAFIDMATQMGMNAAEANTLADKLRLIPGKYTAQVFVDNAASSTIQTIHGQLVNLTNRRWIASVAVTGTSMNGAGRYFAGLEHGGVAGASHAAEGGPRSNLTWVGERGPELVDLAPGSMVHSSPDSMRMMAAMAGGGGGGPRIVGVEFLGNLDSMMATAWMKAYDLGLIRIKVR